MAASLTLVNHGVYTVSGADLNTAVSGITALTGQTVSGAALHFVYVGEGQINLMEIQAT